MGRLLGPRSLVWIGAALAVLLAALAVLQFRWSARVAAADAQREKEHLESAAALFATEFNSLAGQASTFVQNTARAALESGEPLGPLPRLIGDVYYVETPARGAPQFRQLAAGGSFSPVAAPAWLGERPCSAPAILQPPALVVPIYEIGVATTRATGVQRELRTYHWRHDRCFIAPIDQAYLRETLLPQLIRRSFGATAAGSYDFAVIPTARPGPPLYGSAGRADLRRRFLTLPGLFPLPKPPGGPADAPARGIFIRRFDARAGGPPLPSPDLFEAGLWELQVARKGMPLAEAFERKRRFDLLMSLGVEALLVAAVILLVAGARRTAHLADQKVRFVAGVSHELRSPVSAISMLSRNQADGLVTAPEKVRQYGELIHQQSRRLSEMVEQALACAGIHSSLPRPAREPVDLRAVIQEALDARREELDRAGFTVEAVLAPDLPEVTGDARLLRMALDNLLSNALKHAGSGHWMRIAAAFAPAEKEVRISVEDRGAGIAPGDRAEIFEPFYRGRVAVEAQAPGSGLGLSLVRSAAEAHRGTVTLESEPGRGSTFTIHLPV